MSVWESIIIGLLQGLTEFLPVSSSGHMLLAGKILGIEVSLGYELVMHLATLLAVVIVMRKDIWQLLRHPLKKDMRLVVVATIPTAIIVFAFKGVVESTFDGQWLPYCFLVTAALLLLAGLVKERPKQEFSYLDGALIGIAQGLAAFPGISRSGATISTSMMLGNDKQSSARFSFLISIPVILGSSLIEIIGGGVGGVRFLPLAAGFVAAFVSGFAAIRFMLSKLKISFDYFAIYLLALSIFLFLNSLWLHWF